MSLIFSVYKHIKRVPINDYSNIIVSLHSIKTWTMSLQTDRLEFFQAFVLGSFAALGAVFFVTWVLIGYLT